MSEHAKNIGLTATYRGTGNGLVFEVRIIDFKSVFGRIDYHVEPVAGSGSAWVSSDSIVIND